MRISYKPENNTKYSWLNVCVHATYQFYYRPSHTHMCESYVTSNPGSLSLSLFLLLWSRGSQNLGAPLPPKMQLEQNVKKFNRQKLRKHGFKIPTDLRRKAIDVTNAFELKGKLACFPRAWRRLSLFALRCDWLVKPSRELLRFVVG